MWWVGGVAGVGVGSWMVCQLGNRRELYTRRDASVHFTWVTLPWDVSERQAGLGEVGSHSSFIGMCTEEQGLPSASAVASPGEQGHTSSPGWQGPLRPAGLPLWVSRLAVHC